MALLLRLFMNRDMPTLSLKVKPSAKALGEIPLIVRWARGRVCVPLFLFVIVILQIISTPVFAQDLRNRTEEMYPFGTVIIAKESLPDRVYESQRNKILISVIYFEKGTSKTVMSSMGT
ncbi:MAG TPA: hypothetical protein VJC06_00480, partial [Candidatus Paceibacterota bacterium]